MTLSIKAFAIGILFALGALMTGYFPARIIESSSAQDKTLPCVIGYQVIARSSQEEVVVAVNNEMGLGWKPQGGLSVVAQSLPFGRRVIYSQAMIRQPC